MASMTTKTKCPNCQGDRFGETNDKPVTMGGWCGDVHFTWGRYAGVHMVKATAKRCADCGYVQPIDPGFD